MYPYGNNVYNVDYNVGVNVPTSNLYSMNNTNPYGTVTVNTNVSPFLNNNPYGTLPNPNPNPYGNLPQYPPVNTNPYGTLPTPNPYGTLSHSNSFTNLSTNQYGTPMPNNYGGISNPYGTGTTTLNTNQYGLTGLPNTTLTTNTGLTGVNPYGLPPNTGLTGLPPNTTLTTNTGLTGVNPYGLPPNTGLTGLPPNTNLTNTGLTGVNPYGLPPTTNTGLTGLPNTTLTTNTGLTGVNPYGLPPNTQQNTQFNPQLNNQVNPQINEELQKKLKETEEQRILLEKLQKEKEEIERKRQQELLEQQQKSELEKKRLEEQIRQFRLEQEKAEKEKREKELENQRLLEESRKEAEEIRLRMDTEKRRILLENRKKQEEMDLRIQQTLQEKELEQQRIMQIVAQKLKEEERMTTEKEKEELIKNFQQQLSLKEMEQQRIQQEHSKLLELAQQNENQKQSWEIDDPSSIITESKIGQGQFGEIWKGKMHGKEVAIKKLLVQKLDEQSLKDFKKELNLMSHLRHPNLIMLMAATTTPGNMMIITPYIHRGSLDHILESQTPLSLRMRLKICKDIAVGMCWLHNQKPPIIHRDLKPANVLIDLNWNGIVADFGLAQIKSVNGEFTGSPYYMAPELLLGKVKQPTTEIDVYAFGITLWEIYTRKKLYDGEFEGWEELTDGVALNGFRPELPKDIHPFLKKLIEDCWEDDPQKRPHFNIIVNSNILDNIMIDSCIVDPSASHFWKTCFLSRSPNDSVAWIDFVQGFGGFFQMDWKGNEIKGECLKALICNDHQVVEIETFGRIAAHFGPCDGLNFLNRIHEILESGWFHGPLSPLDADNILQRSKRNGTYLVRFALPQESNGFPAFSLSVLQKDQGTQHFLIIPQNGKFVINNKPYDSLGALLLQERKDLGLGIPSTGSKYDALFPEEKN